MDQILEGTRRNQLANEDIQRNGNLLVEQINGYRDSVLQIGAQIKKQDITPQLPAIQNL